MVQFSQTAYITGVDIYSHWRVSPCKIKAVDCLSITILHESDSVRLANSLKLKEYSGTGNSFLYFTNTNDYINMPSNRHANAMLCF